MDLSTFWLHLYLFPFLFQNLHHPSSLHDFFCLLVSFVFLASKEVFYEQLFPFLELNVADSSFGGNCSALLSWISLTVQEFNISHEHRGTKWICFTTEQLHCNKQQQVPLRYAPPLNFILHLSFLFLLFSLSFFLQLNHFPVLCLIFSWIYWIILSHL